MTEEEIEKKAKKYAVRAESFSRGLVGAQNVKVAMMSAYKEGLKDGCEAVRKKDSQISKLKEENSRLRSEINRYIMKKARE